MASIQVLDHGFVRLRNIAGPTRRLASIFDADDVDPANSARMSFGQTDSGRTREQDLRLAEYLAKNHHNTPFEMVEIWLEMKLPIFLARQFVRHRTATINEISGRYVQLPEEYYVPATVGGKSADKKQGQEDNLPDEIQEEFQRMLEKHSTLAYDLYQRSLAMGVAPEHARLLLGLNQYTHWLWHQDLHNMMNFLSLRSHHHAQIEAQIYANAIIELLKTYLPNTMELYYKYRHKK